MCRATYAERSKDGYKRYRVSWSAGCCSCRQRRRRNDRVPFDKGGLTLEPAFSLALDRIVLVVFFALNIIIVCLWYGNTSIVNFKGTSRIQRTRKKGNRCYYASTRIEGTIINPTDRIQNRQCTQPRWRPLPQGLSLA